VDFGASDKPLKPSARRQWPHAVPHRGRGVVPVVNLEACSRRHQDDRGGAGDIYRGVRTYWTMRDQIVQSGVKLPHERITVVHRSDGSGTTFLFTSYLSLKAPTGLGVAPTMR